MGETTATGGHKLKMDRWHRYECVSEGHPACVGKVYRSVTTILGKSVPKDLSWWGMTIGAEAVKELLTRGYPLMEMDDAQILDLIKSEKLTVRDTMNRRGAEGTAFHESLEAYINDGTLPKASDFPPHEQPRVKGLAKFILTYDPEFLASEVQVVSVEHGYAGTYDFEANVKGRTFINGRGVLCFKPDAKACTFTLGDLKTSKWVYPTSHFPQLEAYEGARVECGRDPTEVRAVLHVTATGGMAFVPSTFTFDDFLVLKRSAEVVERGDRQGRQLRKATT